jgi:hypothetical protein
MRIDDFVRASEMLIIARMVVNALSVEAWGANG